MTQTSFFGAQSFAVVRRANSEKTAKIAAIADMCRFNVLNMVKRAGSGHMGTSFSSMDILAWLYEAELDTARGDVFFSSKGHDAPAIYAMLHAKGILPDDAITRLRRLDGLPGHPEVGTPGIEANTGSLGMGISKARGRLIGRRLDGKAARVFVLLGDGELQEGKNWEALAAVARAGMDNLRLIVDFNKVQSDRLVTSVADLGDIEAKFTAFGWSVRRCDGHDLDGLEAAFRHMRAEKRPCVLIADTIKGRGISFMEHIVCLKQPNDFYQWHAGAPADEPFQAASTELLDRISGRLDALQVDVVAPTAAPSATIDRLPASEDSVSAAFGAALVDAGRRNSRLVAMTADLAFDCRMRDFEAAFPDRFFECGIAEQDMVSTASGLAMEGFLPVMASFGVFLAARANEQIYNNVGEHSRGIYVCQYAGLLPAAAGHSHQSVRDISLFGALPGITIVQPCCGAEMKLLFDHCVDHVAGSSMIRMCIMPSPRKIDLPADYRVETGRGFVVDEGADVALVTYGPVMLSEALEARHIAAERGVGVRVINMPWLSHVDTAWLCDAIGSRPSLIVEDHSPVGGLGDRVLAALAADGRLADHTIRIVGVTGIPASGAPNEVLRHHGLDRVSLAERVCAIRS
jgi:transketolase